ncbi:hypothetical protein M0R72_11465 [Candidatus Pacearchaeota archaeon]|jgi:hypothetical protein|nr:hypothetical protein [Candidatus Pacearchaeota archaeon]
MFKIDLDRERHAKFTLKALKKAGESAGKNYASLKEDLSLEDVEIILWACLLKEDPDLKLELVQNEVEMGQLRSFIDYMSANPT